MPKCRWIKEIIGRKIGEIEDRDDSLIEVWETAGYVERIDEEPEAAPEGEVKAVDAAPVDRAIRPKQLKRK